MPGRLVRSAAMVISALLSLAAGPLDASTRRCLVGYTELLRRVSLQAGLSTRACVRDALRGVEPDLDACVAGDHRGTIALRQARVNGLYTAGVCRSDEPLQLGATTGNAAHRQAAIALAHDLFSDPLGAVGGTRADAACLDAGVKAAIVDLAAIVDAHRACLARGLGTGTITDVTSLAAACGTRAQVDAAGRAPTVLARLAGGVQQACAGRNLSALFDGLDSACHASADALARCIGRAGACRACRALNASHGSHRDCDAFDDGTVNDSCDESVDPAGAPCRLGPGSRLRLASVGLPLDLALTGSLRITCAAIGADGIAPCRCDLDNLFPPGGAVVIPAIGDVCIHADSGCAPGTLDCDGGRAVDVDLAIDHDIGDCSGNADCAAACAAYCGGIGAGYAAAASACEGFCQGGARNDAACTADTQCPAGRCAGLQSLGSHGNTCNCQCQGRGLGIAAAAGALTCDLGTRIDIELPSNGRCGETTVASYPPFCVALTTGAAPARIANANDHAGITLNALGPGIPSGQAIACDQLAQDRTAGLTLVGGLALLDSTLGDVLLTAELACE